jgi:Secretion system C-terminal sorting domain
MKKILLLSTFLLMGILSNAQVQKRVLIEEFTNASCGPCAGQNPKFNTLLAKNPTKVVQIKYQVWFPGFDPMYLQDSFDVKDRYKRYNFTGVPSTVINGDTSINTITPAAYSGAPANVTQAMIDKNYDIITNSTPIELKSTYNYNPLTDSITASVIVTNKDVKNVLSSAVNSLRLMVVLVEMNINFANPPGNNGETAFYYVMRKMYPNESGTKLPDTLVPGVAYTFNYNVKAPSYIYQKNQMALVTFLQDLNSSKVYQSDLVLPPNSIDISTTSTGTLVSSDFCSATIDNPSLTFVNESDVPITKATVGYTLNGTVVTSKPWTGNLAKGQSEKVTFPNITLTSAGANYYDFFINAINTNGIDYNESNNILNQVYKPLIGKATSVVVDFESNKIFDISTSETINDLPEGAYIIDKSININLTQKMGGFGLSDKSFRFNCYNVPNNINIGLISYKQNLTATNFDNISFDYAYNNYVGTDGTFYDGLALKISKDCGATWSEIWKKTGIALKTTTAAGIPGNFYPTATTWKNAIATIPAAFINSPELVIKVEAQSGFGNNIYVDNITLTKATATSNLNLDNAISVYPNPVNDKINIVGIEGDAQVALIDIYGRTIQTMQLKNNVGTTTFNVDGFVTGNYLLRITQDGDSVTKSIMIK